MRGILLTMLTITALKLPVHAGEPQLSASEYIAIWKDEAIYQMAAHKIPASITLAQGMLESGNGNSRLARKANNHFGIKCHNDWDGEKMYEDDDQKNECFRKYDDARQSYEDHSVFLKRKRYEKLFDLEHDDAKGWAKGLKECGYATNPKYPDLLLKLIREHNLDQYDEIGKQYLKKGKLPDRPKIKGIPKPKKEEPGKPVKENQGNGEEPKEINIQHNRAIEVSENRIRYTVAKEGETPAEIASDFDMGTWQILRYNDLESTDVLKEGQRVYLQPKRSRSNSDTYVAEQGDNCWSISQEFGIRLKKLRKLNSLEPGEEPAPGTRLRLR